MKKLESIKVFSKDFLKKTKKPLSLLVLNFVVVVGLSVTNMDSFHNKEVWEIVEKVARYLFVLSFTWFIYLLLEFLLEKIITLKVGKRKNAKKFFKSLNMTIRIISGLIFSLYSMDFWGVDITKFLAAGGIVGLAVGLAAKEFLSNLFGGLVIFLDKPFSEGEWISSPDRRIEGTVKKIKMRVTEIETFDKRPLYIPNSTFLNIIIENPNRMKNRRICEDFSLRYNDSNQVKKIVYEIENYLKNNPAIEVEATIMVHLVRFSESSLDCQIYCFTKTSEWKLYREIKQEVILKIIDIVKNNKADIAFPTRTIEMKEQQQIIPIGTE